MAQLDGRVALVTGAASGIGASTAGRLAAAGAFVYCTDLDGEGAARRAVALTGSSGGSRGLPLDVTREEEWAATLDAVHVMHGRLDVLVNCAGVSSASPLADTTLDEWRRVFAVNVEGVFLGLKYGIRAMRTSGGSIVNVTSMSGVRPAAGAPAYSSAKAAVGMLTRAAAKECREQGLSIRVNAVAPGGVKTSLWRTMAFFRDLVDAHGSEAAAFEALGGPEGRDRFADADEVSDVILFLASPAARHVNGVELPVDGGSHL